jgi:hypothetical protein
MGKVEVVQSNNPEQPKVEGIPDPFDLTSLRINPSYLESAKVKRVRPVVTGRPSPQDFFRVHPDPSYRTTFGMIELKEDREDYLVVPDLVPQLPGEVILKTMYTTINRQGTLRLWSIRVPNADERKSLWWQSGHEAADQATTKWLRIKPNMDVGAYEMLVAESEIPEPNWSEIPPFKELLHNAYRLRVINDLDHAVIKKLRGLA